MAMPVFSPSAHQPGAPRCLPTEAEAQPSSLLLAHTQHLGSPSLSPESASGKVFFPTLRNGMVAQACDPRVTSV